MKITFFKSPADFRKWLAAHHATEQELWVGYYKKDSGKPSVTWPESVDEALCFGWIDGIRKSVDEISYTIRFTPRRPRSRWSAVNLKRVEELMRQGRMQPAGQRVFDARDPDKSGLYSYEQSAIELDEPCLKRFRKHKGAWEFYQAQPPYYRKLMAKWVMDGKKEETRLKRLAQLIEESARSQRIPLVTRKKKTE